MLGSGLGFYSGLQLGEGFDLFFYTNSIRDRTRLTVFVTSSRYNLTNSAQSLKETNRQHQNSHRARLSYRTEIRHIRVWVRVRVRGRGRNLVELPLKIPDLFSQLA